MRTWILGSRCALVTMALLATGPAARAQSNAWQIGDVFLAVGGGGYHVYDRVGQFKESLSGKDGGFTTDCGFTPDFARLVTTNFTNTRLVVFDDAGDHRVVEEIDAAEVSPAGHSSALAFWKDGGFYVGHADGNQLIHQYGDGGSLLRTFAVDVEGRGLTGLDLASDQRTLFYTTEGRYVLRFDTATESQLPDFAELPGEGHATALRLLSPGDGSGGLLVVDGSDIKRLDAAGEVVQTYDVEGRDSWSALSLDPDGKSVWATDYESDRAYRFGVDTGAILSSFGAGPGNTVFGVCQKGELTAAVRLVMPRTHGLQQNAPNPFNPSTEIRYDLAAGGDVRLSVYNLLGQRIRLLVEDHQIAGAYSITWNGVDDAGQSVASGVYLYRIESDGLVESRRMLLLK